MYIYTPPTHTHTHTHTNTHTQNNKYVPYEKQQYTNKKKQKNHYVTTYPYNDILWHNISEGDRQGDSMT